MPNKGLINSVLFWWIERRIKEISLFSSHSAEIQQSQLNNLLSNGKETIYGKSFNFSELKNYQQFKNTVPIVSYENFHSFIERSLNGEKEVFWNKPINWYAKSSGTSNAKSKFIPISKNSLESCHFKGGKDMFALYANNNSETKIFDLLNLRLGGSFVKNKENNYLFGDLSSILIHNLPIWAEIKNTPSKKTSLISSWEEKLPLIIKETMEEEIGCLTGVPSWMYVFLTKLLEQSNKKYLDEIWPTIEVFFHGGISFNPYKENFNNLFSNPINYLEVYNASDGFFAIQDTKSNKDGLLLMLDYGIFYEFISMDNYNLNNAIPLWEVELNTNYAMVITTNGGLWRYLIGDTVKFISKNPYRIIISGRTQLYINAFGEELMIDNTEKAIGIACKKTNAEIIDYTVAPRFMQKESTNGAHEWIIEFKKDPTDLNLFNEIIDQTLKELNSDYEAKRKNNVTLSFPIIILAKKNLFYTWLKNKNKLGGQNKIPRLCNDRIILEELIILNSSL
ncbi:MAG: GH3 auxin-responsive promoter family protein [Solirubrobacteraceae bacterium]